VKGLKYKSFIQNFCCNTYIIYGKNGDCAVIDPGYEGTEGFNEAAKLGDRLKYILLTHRHSDHLLAAIPLKKLTGASIAIHKDDEVGLLNPKDSLFYEVSSYFFEKQEVGSADILLNDGDTLDIGGDTLTGMHTPGHSAGCICFLGEGVIFSGDTLFAGSMGRVDFPTGDVEAMAKSLIKLSGLEGSLTLCAGHGETSTIETENNTNPYIRMAKNGTLYG